MADVGAKGVWLALDARFLADPRIEELVEEHGPGGALIVIALLAEAKTQQRGGVAKVSLRRLARDTGLKPPAAGSIVTDAEKQGVLDLLQSSDREVTVEFPKWGDWQKDVTNAARQARHRQRQALRGVTRNGSNALQDRTGQEKETPLSGEPDEAGQIRELADYWREKCRHPQAKVDSKTKRWAKVKARLRDGYTPEQIRQAIDGAASKPYVNDEGKRFDDLELVCRSAEKLEDFMGRAATNGKRDFLAELAERPAA